ncbi:MAG: signal peptidase II [Thermodesulfovibrionales bacterium]|nr:signal peptidase II [Thermodesulfovibrionales bacterium]
MTLNTYLVFVISLVIYLIDQTSKYAIKKLVNPTDVIAVTSFFNIVYVENVGSAFGMFKSLGNVFFITISIIAIGFITFLIFKDKDNRLPYSLLLAGAFGNMTDRLIYGYVIDFFDFYIGKYHWYVFNVADASLTCGMVLMLINAFFIKRKNDKVETL